MSHADPHPLTAITIADLTQEAAPVDLVEIRLDRHVAGYGHVLRFELWSQDGNPAGVAHYLTDRDHGTTKLAPEHAALLWGWATTSGGAP